MSGDTRVGLHTSFRAKELDEPLRRAAARAERTVSHQIRHYIREGLRRDGLLEDDAPPKR